MTEAQEPDLNFIKMIGPLPLFWGEDTDSMDKIEAAGYTDYYLVAQEKFSVPTSDGKGTTVIHRPGIFRVTSTIIGRAIVHPDNAELNVFCSGGNTAEYTMPKMPWSMVQQMDKFFRKAHEKHGTEAILVLTYDPNFLDTDNPGAGWNCIAPDQKNTAGNCDYDPPSVQKYKTNDDELIVGTIHSHPEMSAFFSSTDHKDQDDWDGIHITQAWRGKGPTEYYIAFVLGGKQWELKPEQVFDSPPLPQVDHSPVDEWLERVEKKTYTNTTHSHGYTPHSTSGHTPGTSSISTPIPLPTQGMMPAQKTRAIKLPATAPDPRDNVIIPVYKATIATEPYGSVNCRLCNAPLLAHSIHTRRCLACSGFLIFDDETLEQMVEHRSNSNLPYSLEIDPERTQHAIILWHTDGSFVTVHSPDAQVVSPK